MGNNNNNNNNGDETESAKANITTNRQPNNQLYNAQRSINDSNSFGTPTVGSKPHIPYNKNYINNSNSLRNKVVQNKTSRTNSVAGDPTKSSSNQSGVGIHQGNSKSNIINSSKSKSVSMESLNTDFAIKSSTASNATSTKIKKRNDKF